MHRNDYEAFVFIFLLWNFYPAANEFWYTLYFVKHVKYPPKMMRCYGGTDTSTTVDILGSLETRGEESVSTGCLSKPTIKARGTANVIRKL